MQALLDSHVVCPGDGNLDGVVDAADVEGWQRFNRDTVGQSSWYDFNHDGLTNEADLLIIQENMGRRCGPAVS